MTVPRVGKNQKISYPSLKSKYVLLDFWFSHCSPCIGQFPDYVKLVNEYRKKGFTLIGISSDASHADIAAWKEVIHSQSLNWLQYRTDDATLKNLRIIRAPSNFLLDGSGNIIAKDLLPNELADFLRDKL